MEKIIFYSDEKQHITRAYTREQRGDYPVLSYGELVSEKERYREVEYLFSTWGLHPLSALELEIIFPKLKAVFYAAGTVQYFARPFLERGIAVFSAWAANAVPVAEFAAAQIILANKGYFQLHERYQNGGFEQAAAYAHRHPGTYGTRVGLLGAGMIGKYVIRLLSNYRLQIHVFDPFLTEEQAGKLGVSKDSLEHLFESCQVISNHLANNEQTRGMIDYRLFSRMQEYTTFINTGRGAQVVTADLLRFMREHPSCSALLDVTDPIEPLPAGSPLLREKNIFITPHIAGSISGEIARMGEYMFEEYDRVLTGRETRYQVTSEMLETMA